MHQLLVEDLVTSPDLTPREGKIGLIEAPGLGVELDRDAVERAAERYEKGVLS
jgi:L-alanine-DL-glutamate epimerase-like enolase superfamily enzyme